MFSIAKYTLNTSIYCNYLYYTDILYTMNLINLRFGLVFLFLFGFFFVMFNFKYKCLSIWLFFFSIFIYIFTNKLIYLIANKRFFLSLFIHVLFLIKNVFSSNIFSTVFICGRLYMCYFWRTTINYLRLKSNLFSVYVGVLFCIC